MEENNNNSSEETTDTIENTNNLSETFHEKLSRFGEDAENICKIFVPISAVFSALFLFGYYIYNRGYNEYFNIGEEWLGEISLSSVFRFVFIMLMVSGIMLPNLLSFSLSNLIMFGCNKWKKIKDKKILKILVEIFLHLISIVGQVFILYFITNEIDGFNDFKFFQKFSLLIIFWFLVWGLGFIAVFSIGSIESSPTSSSQSSLSTEKKEKRKKIVLYIFSPIIAFLFIFLIVFIVVDVYSMGADSAESQKKFKVIEIFYEEDNTSSRWIVLTENDDKILLAELTSEANGIAEINTKKQKVIENSEYDYEIIEYADANVPGENDG